MPVTILPNFIIAGVNKAATTSVFQYLSHHPEVCCSSDKETNYFLPLKYGKTLLPIDVYKKQFRTFKNQKYVMEASPLYFYGGSLIATTIKNTVQKDCKILIILREPVSRLISFFFAKKKSLELEKNLSFSNYIDMCMNMQEKEILLEENNKFTGIFYGCYINYIKDWFTVFGNNLKIAFYDNLNSNPQLFMKELCNWLEIDGGYFDNFGFEIENRSFLYKSRFLQKMAIEINYGTSRFWRKNPALKKWVRKYYFKLNKSEKQEEPDKESLNLVSSLYYPYNRQLNTFLVEKGICNLPSWL
jgi:sulfotransferase family protein